MKVAIGGQGAFGIQHIKACQAIPGVQVTSLVGGSADSTKEVAAQYNIPHWTTDLAETLKRDDVEAVILATPTQMHAAQGIQCMEAGKHVQIEIPIADNLKDSEALAAMQRKTGLIAMGG